MTGSDNVRVVRDQYEATNARDFERAMEHYADDVELVVPSPDIRAGTFRGREAVGRWFGDWFSSFAADYRFEIRELSAIGDDAVVVVADHHGRGRKSGVEVRGSVVWLYRLRGGRITQVLGCQSREEAVEAARVRGA